MRGFLSLAFILAILTASATDRCYDPPRRVSAAPWHNETMLDTIATPVSSLTFQARCAPADRHARQWAIVWNYTDSLNMHRAEIVLSDANAVADDIYPRAARIRVAEISDGRIVTEKIYPIEGDISDITRDFCSLKLIVDEASARLYYGRDKQHFVANVDFDCEFPGSIGISTNRNLLVKRFSLVYLSAYTPSMSRFSDVIDLQEYLEASTDPIEGIWTYLDRDTDQNYATLGGKYTLAIAKAADGKGYDIIYLSGGVTHADKWAPLQIKGHLEPTYFANHFDLVWFDSECNKTSNEQNATFDTATRIATFSFPMLNSKLRFSKTPLVR